MTNQNSELTDSVNRVARVSWRNRFTIHLLGIALAFDVLLTGLVGGGAIYLHRVSNQAATESCVIGNRFRHDEKRLWSEFLNAVQHPHPTVRQAQIQYVMRRDLTATVLQRNCKKL